MPGRVLECFLPPIALLFAVSVAADASSPDYQRALDLMTQTPLIDGHNDLPWQYRTRVDNHLDAIDLTNDTSKLSPPMHTDISRLRAGRVGAQFWSVYVPPSYGGDEAVRVQLEQIDLAHRLIETHEELELVTTADELERVFAEGRIASMLGMEGGHVLNNSLANLRMFHRLGALYLTLTHGQSHDWADAVTDTPRHGGLSEFGREVVREMNRLGMLVDLSHVSPAVMHDALDVSAAPVIFSHSSAMGVTRHARNVPDDVLDRLPSNGGIIMVTFVPIFINEQLRQWGPARAAEKTRLQNLNPNDSNAIEVGMDVWLQANPQPVASLADVADHIDYIRDRVGTDHIGIGGDYEGFSTAPVGLEDVSTYPALIAELIRRGYSDKQLAGIIGNNALRVMREAEAVAKRLQAERPASDVRYKDFELDQEVK
jgi:membrane dipeptidase